MNHAWARAHEGSFVVLWTIENLRYVDKQKDTGLCSPVFTMDSTGTRWEIILYPNHHGAEKVGVYLYRNDDGYNESISLQWIIKIIKEGNVLAQSGTLCYVFEMNSKSGYGNTSLIELNKLLSEQTGSRLYYDDVLILCEMWTEENNLKLTKSVPDDYSNFESIGPNINLLSDFPSGNFVLLENIDQIERRLVHDDNRCNIRTIINAKETELDWTVERFSELQKNKKKMAAIKHAYSESFAVVISYLNNDDVLQIDVLLNKTLTGYEFVQCHLSVRDKHNGVEKSFQKVCYLKPEVIRILSFPDVIKKSDVLAAKEKLLDRDALNLHFVFTFVEEPSSTHSYYSTGSKPLQTDAQENHLSRLMEDMFVSRKQCDVTLRAGSQDIPCHKAIVCHMSPVLDAMFTADMQEKKTGVVQISDIDPDTLNTLLRYMYTGEMDDMGVEEYMKLFVASDKYQVSSLTSQCRKRLDENLSVDNVCSIFLFADAHSDVTLKKSSMDFIRSNVSRVFSLDEWRSIAEDNPKMASEVILFVTDKCKRDDNCLKDGVK